MSRLRIVFMGTADLSCPSLRALHSAPELEVVAAVTQPDRPKGRELKLHPSPVKELALVLHLPVLQPERARNEDFINQLRELNPDLIAVAAYGQILPPAILDLPRFGCLNVHTSLLPKYRGAAPIQWAILNDEAETGATIMKMDAGLDTGAILARERTPIGAEDNSETLHERLGKMGAELLVRTIPEYVAGKIQPQPQSAEGVSYAPKIKKQDGQIDWSQPARAIWNRVRGLIPWPGAFTYLPDPPSLRCGAASEPRHLLKVWQAQVAQVETATPGVPLYHPMIEGPGVRAAAPQAGEILRADKAGIVIACGEGEVRLLVLQREGGRRLSAQQFLAGHALKPGQRLG